MPHRVLVVYGTSYGQTERIARRIAEHLDHAGLTPTLIDARAVPPDLDLTSYDAFVVGASMIARGHQPPVREFIAAHRDALARKPSAFFSVCASAGSVYEKNREAARKIRDAFLDQVGWAPSLRESIAGAINYTRYNFLLRWYMKKASRLNGGSTDTSRDHEYTDWDQVRRFARAIAAAAAPRGPADPADPPALRASPESRAASHSMA